MIVDGENLILKELERIAEAPSRCSAGEIREVCKLSAALIKELLAERPTT